MPFSTLEWISREPNMTLKQHTILSVWPHTTLDCSGSSYLINFQAVSRGKPSKSHTILCMSDRPACTLEQLLSGSARSTTLTCQSTHVHLNGPFPFTSMIY